MTLRTEPNTFIVARARSLHACAPAYVSSAARRRSLASENSYAGVILCKFWEVRYVHRTVPIRAMQFTHTSL